VLTLALDTSSPAGSVAILRDEDVIAVVCTRTEEAFSSRIFRQIEFLLQEMSVALEEFDVFAVVAGPGSFTGVRVGLTAVKGWAEVYGKPAVALSALEALASQAAPDPGVVFPVLDARRGQFYWGAYRHLNSGEWSLEGEECVSTPEEFYSNISDRSPGSSQIRIVASNAGLLSQAVSAQTKISGGSSRLSIQQVSNVLAPQAGHLAYRRALAGRVHDALSLDANYIRRPDAEVNWKGFTAVDDSSH
jgi:tRNA threonylcarbamoyladenosine biosynthesis protein TsaB